MRLFIVTTVACLIAQSLVATDSVAHEFNSVTRLLTDVPPPPQGESQWIARSMRMNGLPMTLKSFRSRLSPTALLTHYEATTGASANVETLRLSQGDWQTLSIRSRKELVTIQVKATLFGTEGTIMVTPSLRTADNVVDTSFPRPATTTIVNLQEFDDNGIEAEHISLSSMRSVLVEANAFTQRLQHAGWQIVREEAPHAASTVRVLEAQNGAQHALLTLMRNNAQSGTAIVIVWKKS